MSASLHNVVNNNRTRLETVIPLESPFSMFVDPSSLCNFKCSFCAMHGSAQGKYFKGSLMDFELFKKIVDEIARFPQKLKMLRLSHFGEPLLNPRFPDMVRYAKDAGISDHIEAVTNGSLLNPELNQKIIDAGIDRIRISVEGLDSETYFRVSGVEMNMQRFINNIKDLYERSGSCEICCRTVDISVQTEEEKQRFYEMFSPISDKCFIDNIIPLWAGYDEINKVKDFTDTNHRIGAHGQAVRRVLVCPVPYYTMTIHADGEVGICCADWERQLTFGNVTKRSLIDIWNSRELLNFWILQAEGKRSSVEVCRVCLNPEYDRLDDLDEYSETLLQNLKRCSSCDIDSRRLFNQSAKLTD